MRVEIMTTTASEQYQTLQTIWPKWHAVATSSGLTDRKRAENAVLRLYEFYRLPNPAITWIASIRHLPEETIGTPIISHIRETLIHSVWHRLTQPHWVCTQIGYNPHDGSFRLPANKLILTGRSNVFPRTGRRPLWLSRALNMISQFDVDALAIHDLAAHSEIRADRATQTLGRIVGDLVESCFAALLFEETCLLIEKPRKLAFNAALQLSAQGDTAFEAGTLILYCANGQIVGNNTAPQVNFSTIFHTSRQHRLALIEYIGWETLLAIMESNNRARLISRDTYGKLYHLDCGTQRFTVVQVVNKSREPDGSYRRYVIPVDGQCRPLPDPNDPRQSMGAPQALTPLNAVASTFGMTGHRYAAILGKES